MNAGFLAIVEQTKAPLYTLALLPPICMTLAVVWVDVSRWVSTQPEWGLRLATYVASLILITSVVTDGLDLYDTDRRRSREVTAYATVGERIKSHLTPGAVVSILPRWWLLMEEHPRSSLQALWLRWKLDYTRNANDNKRMPQFAELAWKDQVQFIVVDSNVRGFIPFYPSELQEQFWSFLSDCTVRMAEWQDPTYGLLEIYRVSSSSRQSACNP